MKDTIMNSKKIANQTKCRVAALCFLILTATCGIGAYLRSKKLFGRDIIVVPDKESCIQYNIEQKNGLHQRIKFEDMPTIGAMCSLWKNDYCQIGKVVVSGLTAECELPKDVLLEWLVAFTAVCGIFTFIFFLWSFSFCCCRSTSPPRHTLPVQVKRRTINSIKSTASGWGDSSRSHRGEARMSNSSRSSIYTNVSNCASECNNFGNKR